ncbi:glycosyltransferase involved in cell wall biosynthesis [Azonexus fungiphilus]|uniref:Glycosyltransferase involved in cell wall biosynthesis n=1 Tax=Azonexus fungiphilus TaxID=146940 RepID=A0A495WE61_9RHOO|nr:glycosyltransferase [Azonexus fungiphilus]RKT59639.1 glycosyltransferase involved in cell wall biosynthesis [Azonexus fungiphilus]
MKILWFVSSLEQKGGGERFVLETVQSIRADGHDVKIVCDRMHADASFDGRYDLSDVLCTHQELSPKAGYLKKALNKLWGMTSLFRIILSQKPELLICQSEFDAIKLYLISRFLKFRYRVFVFGQMYQFKTDITRYSSVFRQHLEKIIASRPGYKETVMMPPPKLGPLVRWTNELVSRLKFRAIWNADRVFTVSRQVQWEVSLIYQRADARVCRAAFDVSYIDHDAISSPRQVGSPLQLLSVNRLVGKKRIDLMISAFEMCTLDAYLTIIGTGPEECRLKALASQSSKKDRITFLGAVSDELLLNQLKMADCLISLDIGDYDITVVEALGKGVRVVVASDFDTSEFENGFSGLVSVPPEIKALATAIDNIPCMPAPSQSNIDVLNGLTWQTLARSCVAA